MISVYDYEVPKWYQVPGIEIFRHAAWIDSHYLYIHGGMDKENKLFMGGKIMQYNLYELFAQYNELIEKMQNFVESKQHVSQTMNIPAPLNNVQ